MEHETQGAKEATYADVYAIDPSWGSRTQDIQLWARECANALKVLEVGCGDGRIPSKLQAINGVWTSWVGVDADIGMASRFAQRVNNGTFVAGSVLQATTWDAVAQHAPFDVAIIPFSTLFLLPHDQQIHVVRCAAACVRPGGRVVVEAFVPQSEFLITGRSYQSSGCHEPGNPDSVTSRWVRVSKFDVDSAARITQVVRYYGPPDAFQFIVRETIYWRLPAELARLVYDAGLVDVSVADSKKDNLVPTGHIVVSGRV
jgi:SAM-dependent methyltransferase